MEQIHGCLWGQHSHREDSGEITGHYLPPRVPDKKIGRE